MTGPLDEGSDPYKRENYRHMQEKPKIDKMGKLKREIKFYKRGMQRVKTKLQKLQQDPTLAPSMGTVGLRPYKFVDQCDYYVKKLVKYKIHMIMIETFSHTLWLNSK